MKMRFPKAARSIGFAALVHLKWWESQLVEHLIDGLRKAGLQVVG